MVCMLARWGTAAMLVAAAAGCDQAAPKTSDIQVVGSATIEKPAEIFRVSGMIVERGDDQVAALETASAKLDRLSDDLSSLQGLESHRFASTSAIATVARPNGCELDTRGYYGGNRERPADCSPLEAGALISFTIEGAPAEAAGGVVALLVDSDVENASLTGFDVRDRQAAQLEVKQAALADATNTAEALASQAGLAIARPSNIRYGDEARFGGYSEEQGVVLYSALAGLPASPSIAPTVELNLSPTPVRFDAEVAATFAVNDDAP